MSVLYRSLRTPQWCCIRKTREHSASIRSAHQVSISQRGSNERGVVDAARGLPALVCELELDKLAVKAFLAHQRRRRCRGSRGRELGRISCALEDVPEGSAANSATRVANVP